MQIHIGVGFHLKGKGYENHQSETVFGKYQVRDKKARMGRDPLTGESLLLDARQVVAFRPSGMLRKRISMEKLFPEDY